MCQTGRIRCPGTANSIIIRIRGGSGNDTKGACGKDLKWIFDRDSGTLRITGAGDMADGNEPRGVLARMELIE